MATGLSAKDVFELYETGKHRRYSLLFSVNGGAFAIARLRTSGPSGRHGVLGALTLPELSAGMALFTIIMVADIKAFGDKMRKYYSYLDLFSIKGKSVLIFMGAIISVGWLLAGFGGSFTAFTNCPIVSSQGIS